MPELPEVGTPHCHFVPRHGNHNNKIPDRVGNDIKENARIARS